MTIQHLNTLDIRNAVSDIKVKLDALLHACDDHERIHTTNSEIALVMIASDAEITMTNFAEDLRKKMTAGVIN